MRSRTAVTGIVAAVAWIAPLSGVAHAQDLDCRDFAFQEDAQAFFNQDPSDPHRLDEDQGPDDQIACEALPRRGTAAAAGTVTPAATPTRGVRGGVGGASSVGTSGWAITLGVGLTASAFAVGGYVLRARRRS
ncbi:excalibur calcium-binding protein [Streptomyces sp. DT2A-34]|uniref:excalibur calcium-binding protein n=1 Tax=Streptomyces sp. DT2A-34 TaxID=3051182 RepID=UPI00265BC127|nr:excalibur calcium-binding protein [Streptomyces sp. DT2A-34]MDO0909350.1 excalibur calcium-binding protein [Streptomyces sp. DT2A-34]